MAYNNKVNCESFEKQQTKTNKKSKNKLEVKIKKTIYALLVVALAFAAGFWVYTDSNNPEVNEYKQEWEAYDNMVDQIESEYGKDAHKEIELAFSDKDISMIIFVLQKEYGISESKAFVYCQRKLGYKGSNPLLDRDPKVIERVKMDVENGKYPFFNSDN